MVLNALIKFFFAPDFPYRKWPSHTNLLETCCRMLDIHPREKYMKFSRLGEGLWSEWDGFEYPAESEDSIVYYTIGHPDTNHDVVKRALASAIQRDGTADTMGQAYLAVEGAHIVQAQAGKAEGDYELTFYDPDTSMYEAEELGQLVDVTIVEITRGN